MFQQKYAVKFLSSILHFNKIVHFHVFFVVATAYFLHLNEKIIRFK